MTNLGDISFSIILFLGSLILCYIIFRNIKVTKKRLGIMDLVWQSTLLFGIIFATIQVRKHQNTWQFEQNKYHTEYSYKDLIKDLESDEHHLIQMHERAIIANWDSKNEYIEAIKWIKDKKDLLTTSQQSILEDHNKDRWDKIELKLKKYIDTDARIMLSDHKYYLQSAKNIGTVLNKTIENKNNIDFNSSEEFLFYVYPWVLSFILGLRLAQTIFTTFNSDKIIDGKQRENVDQFVKTKEEYDQNLGTEMKNGSLEETTEFENTNLQNLQATDKPE